MYVLFCEPIFLSSLRFVTQYPEEYWLFLLVSGSVLLSLAHSPSHSGSFWPAPACCPALAGFPWLSLLLSSALTVSLALSMALFLVHPNVFPSHFVREFHVKSCYTKNSALLTNKSVGPPLQRR